jgi:predicted membrane protein
MQTVIVIIVIMYLCGFRLRKLFKSNWFAMLIAGFFAVYVTNKVLKHKDKNQKKIKNK